VTEYIGTDSLEVNINASILGINLGNIKGNLKVGLSIKVDLFLVSGEIIFYLKNGNELWALNVKFDRKYNEDWMIISS